MNRRLNKKRVNSTMNLGRWERRMGLWINLNAKIHILKEIHYLQRTYYIFSRSSIIFTRANRLERRRHQTPINYALNHLNEWLSISMNIRNICSFSTSIKYHSFNSMVNSSRRKISNFRLLFLLWMRASYISRQWIAYILMSPIWIFHFYLNT